METYNPSSPHLPLPSPATSPASSGVQWTPGQRSAIEDRGADLVVSASAGSGKTAVLTERVLKLVTEIDPASGEPPARIEEMLIITFTEKAARQMRERIEKRIRKELEAHPDSHALRAAFDGLACAWIMTIDAFCRRLVVENFHEAGVPPSPRIPDGAELAELERNLLTALLEEWAGDPARREALGDLLQACARGADGLVDDVRKLTGFMQSLDRPDLWLAEVRATLAASVGAATYQELPEARTVRPHLQRATKELAEALRELADLADARGGDGDRTAVWRELATQLEAAVGDQYAFRPDALRAWLEDDVGPVLGKLELKKNCGDTLYKNGAFKDNFLKRFSKHYERWRKLWFALDEPGLLHGARLAAAQSLTLLDLAEEATSRLERLKQRRGLLTFNDFERLALKILSDPARPEAPSEIAYRLRTQFKFVLVDEYQDTSPLQDALVRRVARSDDPAAEPNLFLVGDVKQSIYRFRHAEPDLFLSKMRAAEGSGGRLKRINLHENFRSRPAILEFVNHCFEGIMDQAVGELDYGGEERLKPGRVEPGGGPAVAVEAQWLPKSADEAAPAENGEGDAEGEPEGAPGAGDGVEMLAGVEAQAHWVARRIRELTDPESGILVPEEAPPGEANPPLRRVLPGDCALLLRGLRGELEVWTEALEREGLKVRAPGINPLFSTSEMLDLLAALRVADNPFQDIPLATLLRSPLAGFTDDELLAIRMQRRQGAFYAALWECAGRALPLNEEAPGAGAGRVASAPPAPLEGGLRRKVEGFIERVDRWRAFARRGSAYELLDLILNETGYEAFLMGHLDGLARLEHLDFLRGLLLKLGRSGEGTNPLAAFLELIERAEAGEGDVGELPESVAGQMDAVNLLTIHRSKGLEFPIVILPRLERAFRTRKPGETLFDRALGMSRAGVDVRRRRRFPTLALRAMIDRLARKDRSEEIRLLYVAMTRARERLILVGQPGNIETLAQRWGTVQALEGRPAGALDRLHARCPADLLGPIVHWLASGAMPAWLTVGTSAEAAARGAGDAWTRVREMLAKGEGKAIERGKSENGGEFDYDYDYELRARREESAPMRFLPAIDPAATLTRMPPKTSVTKLKQDRPTLEDAAEAARQEGRFVEAEMERPFFTRQGKLSDRKPAWLERSEAGPKRLPADRRGTLTHALLAHVDLAGDLDAEGLRGQTARLIEEGLIGGQFELPELILGGLDFEALAWFFTSEPGRLMRERPSSVTRELAYTARKELLDFDPAAARDFPFEEILVQGVIDAVIDWGNKITVLDYKTDRVRNKAHLAELAANYRFQIEQYAWSLQKIWQLDYKQLRAGLVFLDAREIVWPEEGD